MDDSEVDANLGAELARPRRLTPAGIRPGRIGVPAIGSVPGTDPDGALLSALGKLESALGGGGRARGRKLGEWLSLMLIRLGVGRRTAQWSCTDDSASSDVSRRARWTPWRRAAIEGRSHSMRTEKTPRPRGASASTACPVQSHRARPAAAVRRGPSPMRRWLMPSRRVRGRPWPAWRWTGRRGRGSLRPCPSGWSSRWATAELAGTCSGRVQCGSGVSCSASAPTPRSSTRRSREGGRRLGAPAPGRSNCPAGPDVGRANRRRTPMARPIGASGSADVATSTCRRLQEVAACGSAPRAMMAGRLPPEVRRRLVGGRSAGVTSCSSCWRLMMHFPRRVTCLRPSDRAR